MKIRTQLWVTPTLSGWRKKKPSNETEQKQPVGGRKTKRAWNLRTYKEKCGTEQEMINCVKCCWLKKKNSEDWELLIELKNVEIIDDLVIDIYVLSHFSRVWPFASLWILAHQAPLSMGFFRQENWNALLCPPQGIFLTRGSNLCLLCLLHWQAGSLNSDWIKSREEEERRYWMQCL